VIAQAVNLMNFLKGSKQFIIPIYQQRLTTISLLLAAFGRALFVTEALLVNRFTEAKWKN